MSTGCSRETRSRAARRRVRRWRSEPTRRRSLGLPRRATLATSGHGLPTTLVTRVLREPATIVQRALREPVTIIREPATIVRKVRAQRTVPRAGLAVVVLVLAAVVGLAGGVFAIAGDDPAGVEAPDVVGAKVAAARTELVESARDADLPVPRLKVVDRSYSESAPPGAIIAQDPAQGDRITGNGALLVSVSRGSAYADVPSVSGLAGADAFALLERKGFTPSRTYSPSMEIDAWHAIGTAPETGARVKRPARVHVIVSTGPPRRPVPTLRGLDANAAADALRSAGFVAAVHERPSTTVEPGSLLAVRPRPGARIPLGSTVTLLVARAPHWEAVSNVEGTEDAEPEPFTVPAGARLVLRTVDTSPLGLFGGSVRVEVSGDSEGETEIRRRRLDRAGGRVRRGANDHGRGRCRRLRALDAGRRGAAVDVYVSAVARTPPESRAFSRSTALVWSCDTRDSVTPRTSPISRSVSSS